MMKNPKSLKPTYTKIQKHDIFFSFFSICARETPIIPHAPVGYTNTALPLLFSCQIPQTQNLSSFSSLTLNVSSFLLLLPLNFPLLLFSQTHSYELTFLLILSLPCFLSLHYCKWGLSI